MLLPCASRRLPNLCHTFDHVLCEAMARYSPLRDVLHSQDSALVPCAASYCAKCRASCKEQGPSRRGCGWKRVGTITGVGGIEGCAAMGEAWVRLGSRVGQRC